jgi:hypothetical protein
MSPKPLSIRGSYTKPRTMPFATGSPSRNKSDSNKPSYTNAPVSSIPLNSSLATSTVYFPSYLDSTTPTVTKVEPIIPYYTPSPMPNPTSSPVFTPDTLGHAYGGGWSCVPQKYEPVTKDQSDKCLTMVGTLAGSALPYMPTGNLTVPVVPNIPIVRAMYRSGVELTSYSSNLLAVALVSISIIL